jgi:hypothetical protein
VSPEELRQRVDAVIAKSDDDEAAHGMEDDLYLEIMDAFCPDWVRAEVTRLCAAPFNRWCA